MKIKKITVGFVRENCYIIFDPNTKDAVVVDPGAEGEEIVEELRELNLRAIIGTHGHIDHIGQVGYLREIFNVPFYLSFKDIFLINQELFPSFAAALEAKPCPSPDFDLDKLDSITIGSIEFDIIKTPGHTPGSVCLYNKKHKFIIVGDTLFSGSIGRTDLPGGSSMQLADSLKKLMDIPNDTIVYSGHGPNTTIEKEKLTNPFITGRFTLR